MKHPTKSPNQAAPGNGAIAPVWNFVRLRRAVPEQYLQLCITLALGHP